MKAAPALAKATPEQPSLETIFEEEVYTPRNIATIQGLISRSFWDPRSCVDVEALTQEVFFRAWRGLQNFHGGSSYKTWLYKIAQRVCIDKARNLKTRANSSMHRVQDEDSDHQILADAVSTSRWDDPYEVFKAREVEEALRAEFPNLSERLQTVLELRMLEFRWKETAELLGVSIEVAKNRDFRARKVLRESKKLRRFA